MELLSTRRDAAGFWAGMPSQVGPFEVLEHGRFDRGSECSYAAGYVLARFTEAEDFVTVLVIRADDEPSGKPRWFAIAGHYDLPTLAAARANLRAR